VTLKHCLFPDAGDVWRSDRSVCCPGYVAFFPWCELERSSLVYLLLSYLEQCGDEVHSYTRLGSLFILVAALTMAFGDTVTFDMRSLAVKDYPSIFNFWSMLAF